jgi:hypothetical protein
VYDNTRYLLILRDEMEKRQRLESEREVADDHTIEDRISRAQKVGFIHEEPLMQAKVAEVCFLRENYLSNQPWFVFLFFVFLIGIVRMSTGHSRSSN